MWTQKKLHCSILQTELTYALVLHIHISLQSLPLFVIGNLILSVKQILQAVCDSGVVKAHCISFALWMSTGSGKISEVVWAQSVGFNY